MSSDRKNVLVVMPVVGQPRFSKRIDMMLEYKHQVRVAAFERVFLDKGRQPNCEVTYLGRMEHGKYLKRIPVLLGSVFKLRALLKECDVVYAIGTDLILLSLLAGVGLKHGRMLESGDLREIQTRNSPVGRFFRRVDRFICKRLNYLVVTAPSFLDEYYRKWVRAETPALLFENKVEAAQAEAIKQELANQPPRTSTAVGVGYFGGLQSRWSWRTLQVLAKENPQTHTVLIAGYSIQLDVKEIDAVAQATDNLNYFGEYNSPDDLSELYGQIDLSWACFSPMDPEDWKLRWARSNRFYEACAYETPLLSRQGSDEALVVEKYNIGLVIDDADEQAAVNKVVSVTPEQIAQWKKNMQELPRNIYAYTDESEQLSNAIIAASK